MIARLTIWSYSAAGGNLRQPVILPVETGDAEIVDLATDAEGSGWLVCRVSCLCCAFDYIALVQGADLPRFLRCPRCAHAHAHPRPHWAGSCELRCDCGAVRRVVFVDVAPQPMPVALRCHRCRLVRARVAPWPLPC